MSKTYLGVDIGGTAVKLGLVDENGRVLRRAERSVSFDGYKTPILDTVQTAIHEFLTADAPRLEGIAVSATGQIDSRRGVVAGTCGNFPGWIGVDIKGTLERAFGLPVTVANDANCMLLGTSSICFCGRNRRRPFPARFGSGSENGAASPQVPPRT